MFNVFPNLPAAESRQRRLHFIDAINEAPSALERKHRANNWLLLSFEACFAGPNSRRWQPIIEPFPQIFPISMPDAVYQYPYENEVGPYPGQAGLSIRPTLQSQRDQRSFLSQVIDDVNLLQSRQYHQTIRPDHFLIKRLVNIICNLFSELTRLKPVYLQYWKQGICRRSGDFIILMAEYARVSFTQFRLSTQNDINQINRLQDQIHLLLQEIVTLRLMSIPARRLSTSSLSSLSSIPSSWGSDGSSRQSLTEVRHLYGARRYQQADVAPGTRLLSFN